MRFPPYEKAGAATPAQHSHDTRNSSESCEKSTLPAWLWCPDCSGLILQSYSSACCFCGKSSLRLATEDEIQRRPATVLQGVVATIGKRGRQ
jgi:hypothetical protein